MTSSDRGCDPLGIPGVRFEQHRVEVEAGVSLRIMCWTPVEGDTADPLVFVAGWVSVVEGWAPLLEALVPRQPVVYVETREKRSAQIEPAKMRPQAFTIPRLAEDLVVVCERLGVQQDRALLFGSSMGSNAILEGLKGGRLVCRSAFVIGPNIVFDFPWWGRALTHMPASWYHLAKYAVLWYLRHYRVNTREDPDQMSRYDRTLRAAHPFRLKLSARAVLDYQIWDRLETITAPVAIAFAANDTLHGEDEIRSIAAAIPRGQAVECPTNTYMHTAAVTRELGRFVDGAG